MGRMGEGECRRLEEEKSERDRSLREFRLKNHTEDEVYRMELEDSSRRDTQERRQEFLDRQVREYKESQNPQPSDDPGYQWD